MATLREVSREAWWASTPPTYLEIQTGALQRSADACELMAQNHAKLVAERDKYKRWHEENQEEVQQLQRTLAGLRGYITKLKAGLPARRK